MLWDALRPPNKHPAVDDHHAAFRQETRSFRPTASGLEIIQCNQVVNVVYTEEKDAEFEGKDSKRFYIDRPEMD